MARKTAKKAAATSAPKPERKIDGKSDRNDPRANKSLAIRLTLEKMPNAKASEILDSVKKTYGHDVSQNMVYMIKTKVNMSTGRGPRSAGRPSTSMNSAADWIEAIRIARQLLNATGSVEGATALLKAIDSGAQQAP